MITYWIAFFHPPAAIFNYHDTFPTNNKCITSHQNPVYYPLSLETQGISYTLFSLISKISTSVYAIL